MQAVKEQTLKEHIAHNIAAYRKAMGWTQGELAQKLNYSDKAVSKWERAESLPDVYILKLLADLFGITLDDLARDYGGKKVHRPSRLFRKKTIIPLLGVGLVWLVATNVFAFLMMGNIPNAEYAFYLAIPTTFIVLTVFSAIWWNPVLTSLSTSGIVWATAALLFLLVQNDYRYLFFIIAVPLQILEILWSILRKPPSKPKPNSASTESSNAQDC